MSATHRATPLATSIATLIRPNFSSATRSNAICLYCRRTYRLQPNRPALSSRVPRRTLATEAVQYRSHTLDPHPPPRNAAVPESSIAGGKHSASQADGKHQSTITAASPPTSVTEAEAQSPKSAPNTAGGVGSVAAPEAAPGKAQRKSKLRPRKAAMKLTPAAVDALRELLDQPQPKLIRVGVKNRGCSGLAYHLEYVDKAGAFDEAVDQDGVKVLVDSKALFSIIGSEMDWVEDKLSRRFVFNNPNITEQCGCGESFSIG